MLLVNRDKITSVEVENSMLKCELRKFPGNYMLVKPPLHLKLEKDLILRITVEEMKIKAVPLHSTSKRFSNQYILEQTSRYVIAAKDGVSYKILDDVEALEREIGNELEYLDVSTC